MKKLFTGRVKAILILAVIFALLLSLVSALFGATWPERAVQSLMTPLRSGFSAIARQAEQYYDYVFDYETLEAENAYLRQRITEMEREIRDADFLERENKRYEELLGLSEAHEDYDFCAAYIVAWDSPNWRSAFSIGKGTNAGLAEGMVAVTQNGQVVGLITAVGSNWATVTTILDTSLEISASISSTGHTGVVQGSYNSGERGKLRMNYLPTDAALRNKDQVVTTGSALYPKDLILGYVENAGLDESGVARYAILAPAAEFDDLEQIFIITNYITE